MLTSTRRIVQCPSVTDTTTLKLVQAWLAGGELTADGLYNLIIGQTVLPSWRRLEALGPFRVDAPPSPEDFARRFRDQYPRCKGVVPTHLQQGVLRLLGNGPRDRDLWSLATKIPAALARIQHGSNAIEVLQQDLGLPKFRALLVARLLSIPKPTLYYHNH